MLDNKLLSKPWQLWGSGSILKSTIPLIGKSEGRETPKKGRSKPITAIKYHRWR